MKKFNQIKKYIGKLDSNNISVVDALVDGETIEYCSPYSKNNAICVYSIHNNELETITNKAKQLGLKVVKRYTKLSTGNLYEAFIY